eukprot:sb/3471325/
MEGRHQLQACPLNRPTSPLRILRRFDLCACREVSRTVNLDPNTHIERTIVDRFLCDYHLPRQHVQQQNQQQRPTEDYTKLDLDQSSHQPASTTPIIREDEFIAVSPISFSPVPDYLPPPPPPLSPAPFLPQHPACTPPSPPPLHHLPLAGSQHDAPGPARRGRKRRNITPEEVIETYTEIHKEVLL